MPAAVGRRHPPAWLPNAISAGRIVLVPVFWIVANQSVDAAPFLQRMAPLAVLLTIGGSDLLDGYLACRYQLTSRTGVILDAVADRFAQLAIATFFVFVDPRLPQWFLGLLVGRDLLIGVGTWIALRRGGGDALRHEAHGKAASTVVFLLFVALVAGASEGLVGWLVIGSAVAVTASTVGYLVGGGTHGR